MKFSGFQIKRSGSVISIIIFFGIRKTFTFRRQSVNNHGCIINLFRFFERTDEHRHIMSVNITDIFKTEFIDQRTRQNRRRNCVFDGFRHIPQTVSQTRHRFQSVANFFLQTMITLRFLNAIQISGQCADCGRD